MFSNSDFGQEPAPPGSGSSRTPVKDGRAALTPNTIAEGRSEDETNTEQKSQHESIISSPTSPTPMVAAVMVIGPNAEEQQLPHQSTMTTSSSPTESVSTSGGSGCGAGSRQGEGTNPVAGALPQDGSSIPNTAIQVVDNEEMVITSIRATDVDLGLRRLPAGFYVAVHHSGLEWRTENKRSSVNEDVEWMGLIPIPSDVSADVRLEVYASFEFEPMLGAGEQLRRLTIKVEELLDHSARDVPFTFFSKDGDVVSPCSSISVTVKQRKRKSDDPSMLVVLGPHSSNTGSCGELEDATSRGHSALLHYRKHGERRDLVHSIECFDLALRMCSFDHPGRAAAQSNLATAKFIHCQVEDNDASFDEPLRLYGDALGARPVGHVDRPFTLIQLAAMHLVLFERRRDKAEGIRAEALLHEAMELSHEDSHDNRAAKLMLQLCGGLEGGPMQQDGPSGERDLMSIEDLGNFSLDLVERFEQFGDLADLEQAVAMFKNMVESIPVSDIEYPRTCGNLGMALRHRFERLGEPSDLEDAISNCKTATDLTPDGHPDKPRHLNNLGISFLTRFQCLGELSDLEKAISTEKASVRLTPDSDKPRLLSNLGNSLRTRFERLEELSDLEEAISTQKASVDLTPDGHPNKPGYLNNLGISFFTCFECLGELSDLEKGISTQKAAVQLTPDSDPNKPSRLNNLGNSFLARFQHLKELSDLEEGISFLKAAVCLTPDGHTNKPSRLNNLGIAFRIRFEHLGELSDLEDAVSTQKAAVQIIPDGHSDKPGYLINLGNSFFTRFKCLAKLGNLEQAISAYAHAAASPSGPTYHRFRASRSWISSAHHIRHPSLLRAYSIAIHLLPQLAWVGLSLEQRYSQLAQGTDLVREAAAVALDSGFSHLAVEWLEQGRSIVWGELFQLRSSYAELSSAHPDYARRLRELSAQLEHAIVAREQSLSTLSDAIQSAIRRPPESLQQEVDEHRRLAIARDELLQEIRRLPGFSRFLLQREFSQLRASARSGPVVILNAAESRCDALIVLANVHHVIHVPLPKFNFKRSSGLQNMLEKLLGHARDIRLDEREGKSATLGGVSRESLLHALWKDVVKLVLDALAFSTPGDLSRIFWCPTGPFTFLPLHAAGLYGIQEPQPGYKVSDFAISSYVPNLAILAPSPTVVPNDDFRLLIVRQPPSDGLSKLPGVVAESECIRAMTRESRTTLVEPSVGTVEEVTELMKEADWAHFACHGIQDGVDSGLCLADERRLRVRDIMGLSRRRRGGLAFLSACQTAMGEEGLADEAIYVAAGMLFAGFGGVIGTMWSISDKLAPRVARGIYEQLFQNGTRPNHRDAARALHEAMGRVRESGKASFVTWLLFIHVGL